MIAVGVFAAHLNGRAAWLGPLAFVSVTAIAVFHGHAHGVEMPEMANGPAYAVGFVCATALLHAVGIGLGLAVGKLGEMSGQRVIQVGGATTALAGIAIISGTI